MDSYEVNHDAARRSFEVDFGDQVAHLDYSVRDGRMIITHTEVPAELEGRGIASRLASTALDYAREQQLQVVPLCSFASAYISRHSEYQDLLAG